MHKLNSNKGKHLLKPGTFEYQKLKATLNGASDNKSQMSTANKLAIGTKSLNS